MQPTEISWTDFTSNPLRYRDADGKVVWACTHASPGCEHCYAETLARRYGKGGPFTAPVTAKVTPFLDEKELNLLLRSPKLAGKRCFVGDMTDVFGEWVPDELLDRLFAALSCRQDVIFQLLTKRAFRLHEYINASDTEGRVSDEGYQSNWPMLPEHQVRFGRVGVPGGWPPINVWLGVSVEDQRRADERIPLLARTPAAVRFLSVEPLLGPVDLSTLLYACGCLQSPCVCKGLAFRWVIVGGESGPNHRPMEIEWLADLVEQCRAAGVAVFVKQDAGPRSGMQGRIPDDLWAIKEGRRICEAAGIPSRQIRMVAE